MFNTRIYALTLTRVFHRCFHSTIKLRATNRMAVFIRSAEQNWNFGGSTDEVWSGWHHIQSSDNFWRCGNNIGLTLQKGDMKCTYRASYYNSRFSLVKLNGKQASGVFSYDRSKPKGDVYNAFTQFIENQIEEQKTENSS